MNFGIVRGIAKKKIHCNTIPLISFVSFHISNFEKYPIFFIKLDCNGQEWSFGNNCALNTSSKLVAKSGEANFDEIPAHGRSEKGKLNI